MLSQKSLEKRPGQNYFSFFQAGIWISGYNAPVGRQNISQQERPEMSCGGDPEVKTGGNIYKTFALDKCASVSILRFVPTVSHEKN